jgi:hypothetical protein
VAIAHTDILNEYERLPALITDKGEVYVCADFSTRYARGLNSTNILAAVDLSQAGPTQIVDLNMETCQIEKVIYDPSTSIGDFDISSDGWIAYEARDGWVTSDIPGHAVIVLDDQQREVFRIQNAASPAWSKDGDRLSYTTSINNWSIDGDWLSRTTSISIVNRDGTDSQIITNGGFCQSWSPDGEWLIYNLNLDIYIVNIASKQSQLLYNDAICASWR